MRALIIGAGNAGSRLAQKLYAENYDVVVVDQDSEALAELENELDIMIVQGDGSDPRTLEEARIEKSDVLAGVTNSDCTNILAGILAKRAGTEYVVARVGNAGFLNPREYADLGAMGIDLAINPHQQCALDIFNMLRLPGVIETVGLFDNRIMAAALVIPENSPISDIPIKNLSNASIIDRIRFIARIRGGRLTIPFGDDSFQEFFLLSLQGRSIHSYKKLRFCFGGNIRIGNFLRMSQRMKQATQLDPSFLNNGDPGGDHPGSFQG